MKKVTIAALISLFGLCSAAQAQWEQMDGPYGYVADQLVKHHQYLFMAMLAPAEKAIFRSSDNGDSWEPVSFPINDVYLVDLFTHADILFAVSPEALYSSTNDGESWTRHSSGSRMWIHFFVNFDGLFIAWFDEENRIAVSTDLGKTWEPRADVSSIDPIGPEEIYDVLGDTLYVPEGRRMRKFVRGTKISVTMLATNDLFYDVYIEGERIYCSSGVGIAFSDNGGADWQNIPGFESPTELIAGDETYLYFTSPYLNRIYRLDKHTAQVDSLSVPFTELPEDHLIPGGYDRITGIECFNNCIFAFIDDRGLARSTDHGNTWTLLNEPFNRATVEQFDAVGNDLYAACRGLGLAKSTDMGRTWRRIPDGGHPYDVSSITVTGDTMYINDFELNLMKSTDAGQSWKPVPLPFDPNHLYPHNRNSIAAQGGNLIALNKHMIRTSDDGATWTQTGVNFRGVLRKRDGTIYVSLNNGLAWSKDNGVTWDSSITAPSGIYLNLYDVEGDAIFAFSRNVILTTSDHGTTWQAQPLPTHLSPTGYLDVHDVLAMDGVYIIALAHHGLYATRDNGVSWIAIDQGLEGFPTSLYRAGPYLFAGTLYSGIWRTNTADIVGVGDHEPLPATLDLSQNYPNPVSGTTTVRYSLPAADYVTLVVTNTLGQEVARLADGRMDAGPHSVQFNTAVLHPGVYFYTLRSGEGTVTKSMLVTR